ncbi:hypothetical protein [Halorubrum sp. Ea1]|uniref:hypothetical protein n=1 Tax=Halorubrum sp. Ea1 TaxID=1480718 RepID=UPI00113FC4D3|nr:hypothetical protein [Halorubrum sp. Ea1]
MSEEGIYDEKYIGLLTAAAYFPLYILLPILFIGYPLISLDNILSVLLFSFGIVSAVYSRQMIENARDRGGAQYTIQNTTDKNQEIVQFIVVYIATFLILRDPSTVGLRVLLVVLFLFLMTIYTQYKLSLVYNNPVFAFLDYRVYAADINRPGDPDQQMRAVIILRGPDEPGEDYLLLRRVFKGREIYVSTDE